MPTHERSPDKAAPAASRVDDARREPPAADAPTAAVADTASVTVTDPGHEVRLAIVMYGGISLAIYMNGVAQELFTLVGATARADDDRPARAGDAIATGDGDATDPSVADGAGSNGPEAELAHVYRAAARHVGAAHADGDDPRPTRVVIDILSGASAGGINAIVLAKALAAGTPMPALKDLWIAEGDAARLLADDESRTDLLADDPLPSSLFNGDRMYEKLLEALATVRPEGSGSGAGSGSGSGSGSPPLADDLDLFVTLTDLQGFDVPIRLHDRDRPVGERRHRTVIHFRLDRRHARDDFQPAFEPLLAFAARGTSSLPFVFAPTQLGPSASLSERVAALPPGSLAERLAAWERFFPAYRSLAPRPTADGTAADAGEHARRRFVDGGVLDNKPFAHAIDSLVTRRGATSVTRKLLYVEPSPDHLGASAREGLRSDPFTVGVEGLALPSHETIRDDVERVLERNRQVERVRTLTMGAAEDREAASDAHARLARPIPRDDFASRYLAELIATAGLGLGYGGHHRLKVATVTDDVARVLAELAGLGESDDEVAHLRAELVQPWRDRRFAREETWRDGVCLEPETAFLLRFDLAFRLRRLHFVLERVDEWLARGATVAAALDAGPDPTSARAHTMRRTLERVARTVGAERVDAAFVRDAAFTRRLHARRIEIGAALARIQDRMAALHAQGDAPARAARDPFQERLERLQGAAHEVIERWREQEASAADATAAASPATPSGAFAAFAEALEQVVAFVSDEASAAFAAIVEPVLPYVASDTAAGDAPPRKGHGDDAFDITTRALVADAYWDFERFDMVRFPVMTLAGIGEELATVELHRFSPRDATAVYDEASTGRRKLAGTEAAHFGAFLDERWRRSDIVWGRLDAAELLIGAMVPPGDRRDALVARAHAAICISEGTTLDALRAEVDARPPLDRHAASVSAGRAARVLGRLVDEVRHDRSRVPLLGAARSAATSIGDLVLRVAAASRHPNPLVRAAPLLAAVLFALPLALGLVHERPAWAWVGAVGLVVAWSWNVVTWGFRSWVARRALSPLSLMGVSLLTMGVVVAVVTGVVLIVARSPA